MTRGEKLRREILNAPNLVTLARIALIPFFVALMLAESRRNNFWAAVVFGAASATDFVDGWLARRFNLTTTFGKFIDPLADKLITMSAYVVLVHLARLPAWVVIVIIGRELVITGLRTIAMSEGIVIAAGQGGKWKTALQLAGLIALVIHYRYPIDLLVWQGLVDFHDVGLWLTYASVLFSVTSAVDYFRDFFGGVMAADQNVEPPPPRKNRRSEAPRSAPAAPPAPASRVGNG